MQCTRQDQTITVAVFTMVFYQQFGIIKNDLLVVLLTKIKRPHGRLRKLQELNAKPPVGAFCTRFASLWILYSDQQLISTVTKVAIVSNSYYSYLQLRNKPGINPYDGFSNSKDHRHCICMLLKKCVLLDYFVIDYL